MIKVCFCILTVIMLFGVSISPVKAGPVVDQACLPAPTANYTKTWLGFHRVEQIFTPTVNKIDSIKVRVGAVGTAKAHMSVFDITIRPGVARLLAEKDFGVTNENYYTVDLNDFSVSNQGLYMIRVEPLHDSDNLSWSGVRESSCYPNGYALIDGMADRGLDMVFAVIGYDERVPGASMTPAPNQPGGTASTSPTPITGGNTPGGTGGNRGGSVAPDTGTGGTSNINQKNPYSDRLTNDPELQAEIEAMIKLMEENRYKGGAFGLQGIVGRILTWTVFYVICGIMGFFLISIITLLIVFKVRRKRAG